MSLRRIRGIGCCFDPLGICGTIVLVILEAAAVFGIHGAIVLAAAEAPAIPYEPRSLLLESPKGTDATQRL